MPEYVETAMLVEALEGKAEAVKARLREMYPGEIRILRSAVFLILDSENEVRAEQARHSTESDEAYVLRMVDEHHGVQDESVRPTVDRLITEGRLRSVNDRNAGGTFEVLLRSVP